MWIARAHVEGCPSVILMLCCQAAAPGVCLASAAGLGLFCGKNLFREQERED